MPVYNLAGTMFQIGAVIATKAADFVAADFTTAMTSAATVGETETLGTLGDAWETEDFASIADGRIRVIKTLRKGGQFEITCGLDPADAGQLAMRAAHLTSNHYAFRLTLADKPAAGASPKNSTRTFVGTVIDAQDDASGRIGKVKFVIQINSNTVQTHASAT